MIHHDPSWSIMIHRDSSWSIMTNGHWPSHFQEKWSNRSPNPAWREKMPDWSNWAREFTIVGESWIRIPNVKCEQGDVPIGWPGGMVEHHHWQALAPFWPLAAAGLGFNNISIEWNDEKHKSRYLSALRPLFLAQVVKDSGEPVVNNLLASVGLEKISQFKVGKLFSQISVFWWLLIRFATLDWEMSRPGLAGWGCMRRTPMMMRWHNLHI